MRRATLRSAKRVPARGAAAAVGCWTARPDDQIHVDPLAGAARLDAHLHQPITGLEQRFALPIHERNHAQPERFWQVEPLVDDRKILIVEAQPCPLASAVKPRRPRLAGPRRVVLHPFKKVTTESSDHGSSIIDGILHLLRSAHGDGGGRVLQGFLQLDL